jgi:hypothetical protein
LWHHVKRPGQTRFECPAQRPASLASGSATGSIGQK